MDDENIIPLSRPPAAALPMTILEPLNGWVAIRLRELWAYRELLYFLIWRDVKVRYKQTVLGGAWAILQPVLTTIVFSAIFGNLAKVPSDGIPYPVFAFAALLPWQFFAYAINQSGNSLVLNQQLVTKVYFPRLLIPLASVLAGLVDFAIGFVVLVGMLVYYGIAPRAAVLTLPFFLLLEIATALGVGLWLAALNVQYRDVRFIVPFLTQFWLFITPVAYASSLIPQRWRLLYGLNPMVGVIEGFRWAVLGTETADIALIAVSGLVVITVLVTGAAYFVRMEQTFSDVI
jgi:lipopolysaccharide transport system permease protein